jgi:hypothetical protein
VGCSEGIPRSGSSRSDDGEERGRSPLGKSFLEQSLAGGGSEVEQRISSRINDGGSQQRGAVKSRRRGCVLRCTRWKDEPSGAIVASSIGSRIYANLNLKVHSAV